MEIGTRIPGFARDISFGAYAEWLVENDFDAVDTPPLTREIAHTCKRLGLSIGSCDAIGEGVLSADASVRGKAVSKLKREISATAEHGGRTCFTILSPDDRTRPRAETFEIFRKVYPKIVAHAEDEGVQIALEPYPGAGPYYANLGCSPESLRRIFAVIPSPNLGICYDPSHFVRLQIDHVRLLHEFAERVRHVHLKDTEIVSERLYECGILGESHDRTFAFGEGWWRYTIPGEGIVDWQLVLRRLQEGGYDGVLSVELEDHHYRETPELQRDGLCRARDFVSQFLSE